MNGNSFAIIAITNNTKTKKLEILVQGVEGTTALAVAQKLLADAQLSHISDPCSFSVTDLNNPENNQVSLEPVSPLVKTEIKAPLCKRCGRIMLRKVNKTTKEAFFGCPGFPNCRYTVNESELTQHPDGTPKPTLDTYTLDNPNISPGLPKYDNRKGVYSPPKKQDGKQPIKTTIPEVFNSKTPGLPDVNPFGEIEEPPF